MAINDSIEEIENGESKDIVGMFDDLSQDIVAYSFAIIKRVRKGGIGMVDEEKRMIDEMQYQLQVIHKTLMLAKKAGRLDNVKANEKYAEQLREKIKEEVKRPVPQVSNSIAPIVTMVPVHESPEKKVK